MSSPFPLILLGDPYKIENCHCLKSFQDIVIPESILFKKDKVKTKIWGNSFFEEWYIWFLYTCSLFWHIWYIFPFKNIWLKTSFNFRGSQTGSAIFSQHARRKMECGIPAPFDYSVLKEYIVGKARTAF